ncbi:ribonuclease HI family protein [Candidatus Beckwithbacteria bacterium]|nr:ribonuclease HI family protein [Candidatus Beckwithbacteria bacterium]
MSIFKQIIINTDGGARGNPGPAAIGIVFTNENNILHEYGEYIGESTNNMAEYLALKKALEIFLQKEFKTIELVFLLDSELVVRQLNGQYKVKNVELKVIFNQIVNLLQKIKQAGVQTIVIKHILRNLNKRADQLVNQAIDDQLN